MSSPAIVWRNPQAVQRRRLWNHACTSANARVYIVVRSGSTKENEWEGLPNLEVIDGRSNASANASATREASSQG
jgi:hypothetical protein